MPILNFRLSIATKPKPKLSYISKKIVYGTVINDNGVYKVSVTIKETPKTLEFTSDSYDLKDRKTVFLKKKGKHGFVRIIRDEYKAKFYPGVSERYIPFVEHWVVKGWIVKSEGILMFRFKDLVTIEGYNVFTNEEEE